MNIFLCLVPFLLVKLNFTTNALLSYICSLCSVITCLGLLIFYYEDIKEELLKIFNI